MEPMDEKQINTRRAALHRWIDQAPAEHIARIERAVHAVLAGDTVAWHHEEPPNDRLAPEALIMIMMGRERRILSMDEG
jgi:hypothetical protein